MTKTEVVTENDEKKVISPKETKILADAGEAKLQAAATAVEEKTEQFLLQFEKNGDKNTLRYKEGDTDYKRMSHEQLEKIINDPKTLVKIVEEAMKNDEPLDRIGRYNLNRLLEEIIRSVNKRIPQEYGPKTVINSVFNKSLRDGGLSKRKDGAGQTLQDWINKYKENKGIVDLPKMQAADISTLGKGPLIAQPEPIIPKNINIQSAPLSEKLEKTEEEKLADNLSKYSNMNFSDILRDTDAINAIQETLKNMGFYKKNVDGKYGPGTRSATRDFQYTYGLEAVDGKAGRNTISTMIKVLKGEIDKKENEKAPVIQRENPTVNPTRIDTGEVSDIPSYANWLMVSKQIKTVNNSGHEFQQIDKSAYKVENGAKVIKVDGKKYYLYETGGKIYFGMGNKAREGTGVLRSLNSNGSLNFTTLEKGKKVVMEHVRGCVLTYWSDSTDVTIGKKTVKLGVHGKRMKEFIDCIAGQGKQALDKELKYRGIKAGQVKQVTLENDGNIYIRFRTGLQKDIKVKVDGVFKNHEYMRDGILMKNQDFYNEALTGHNHGDTFPYITDLIEKLWGTNYSINRFD